MNDNIQKFYKLYNIQYDNTQPHRMYINEYGNNFQSTHANISVNSSSDLKSIVTIRHEITIDRPDYIKLINDSVEHNELMEYMLSSENGVKFLDQFRILKKLRS